MAKLSVLGIMSGTSLDGADFVLCTIERVRGGRIAIRYRDQAHSSFGDKLQAALARAARHESSVKELALLHHELGRFYATQALRHQKARRWRVDVVGVHGQTVFHQTP